VTHSYETSRESILPLFDSALQSQRSLPEATAMDLFVRLHGMLFTKISLDSFPEVMSRFMERLEEDASLDGVSRKANVSQVDWMIMATVNIAAVLQYGAVSGVIRRALAQEGAERRRAQAQANDDGGEDDGEVDDGSADPEVSVSRNQSMEPTEHTSPIIPNADTFPSTLTRALELTFAVFAFTLKHPNRLQGLHHVLSPYITLLFTFLATLYRQPYTGVVLTPYIPWHDLVAFLNSSNLETREEVRLVGGAPVPEDWAVRGMEWVGRRVYERGFWKGKAPGRGSGAMAQPRVGERFQSEMDVLLANFDSAVDISEGVVDEVEGTDLTDGPVAVNQRRWKRVVWAAGVLVKHVDGLQVMDGQLVIEGMLAVRIKEKEEEERRKIEEEEQRRMRAAARIVEEDVEQYAESESEEDDSELAALRVGGSDPLTWVFGADISNRNGENISALSSMHPRRRPSASSQSAPGKRPRSAWCRATRCSYSTRTCCYRRSRCSQRSSRAANGVSSCRFLVSGAMSSLVKQPLMPSA
jgi:protein SMG6